MPTTHPPKVPVLWREYLLWLLDVSHILAALSHSQSGKLKQHVKIPSTLSC